jgi:hypothetical protein
MKCPTIDWEDLAFEIRTKKEGDDADAEEEDGSELNDLGCFGIGNSRMKREEDSKK